MPAIYKTVPKYVLAELICDACGMHDPSGCNDFVLSHTFGYGSPIDGEHVVAAICDVCLERIIRESVPNAEWSKNAPPLTTDT